MIDFSHAFATKVFNSFLQLKFHRERLNTHLKIYPCMQLTFSLITVSLTSSKSSQSIKNGNAPLGNLIKFSFASKIFTKTYFLHFLRSSLRNTCSHFSCLEWNEWKFFSIKWKACTRVFRPSILPLAWLSWKRTTWKSVNKNKWKAKKHVEMPNVIGLRQNKHWVVEFMFSKDFPSPYVYIRIHVWCEL